MTTKENIHLRENWETIAVVPAPPDWVNVYYTVGVGYYAYMAPAILMQESATTTTTWNETDSAGKVRFRRRTEATEREVRTVFGALDEFGQIDAADRTGNFFQAMHRSEYEENVQGKIPGPDGYPPSEGE